MSPAGAQRERSRRSLDRCDIMRKPAAGRSQRLDLSFSFTVPFIGHDFNEQRPTMFFNRNLVSTLKAKVPEPFALQPDERPPVFAVEVCIIDSQNT